MVFSGRSSAYRSENFVLELGWSKSSVQHRPDRYPRGPSTPRQKRCVTRSIFEAALRMTIWCSPVHARPPKGALQIPWLRSEPATFSIDRVFCIFNQLYSSSPTIPSGSFDSAPQALCHAIHLRGAALRMTILWELDEKHTRQVGAYGTQSWAQVSQVSRFAGFILQALLRRVAHEIARPEPFLGFAQDQLSEVITAFRRESFSTALQSMEIPMPGSSLGLICPCFTIGMFCRN
jgi:hypothetical protein